MYTLPVMIANPAIVVTSWCKCAECTRIRDALKSIPRDASYTKAV